MAQRGTKTDHYLAIAAYYGLKVIEDVANPAVPGFAIHRAARMAGHFGLAALKLQEKPRRRPETFLATRAPAVPACATFRSIPA